MHPHNHYYGQTHVLARYCGLDATFPPRVRGYLQPSWDFQMPRLFDGTWLYSWSHVPGRPNVHVVGAPWLYLPLDAPSETERKGTLWFFHGWGGGKMPERVIAEIRETEPGPVTVALSPREYQRPDVRAFYADAGFDVLRLGSRGWSYEGTDRRYLHKLLEAFHKHERVASNRLSTVIFYGIAAGCRPAVYGLDPVHRWPEMIGPEIDPVTAREIADQELGTAWRLPPEELRMLLDWPERG